MASALLLAAGCGGSSDEPPTGAATIDSSTEAATTTEPTTPAETEPATPGPVIVRVVVRGGRSDGGIRRATIRKGDRVRLVVVSDTADEVHLHGYDLTSDVAPGRPGRIVFVAKVPGRFEVELEGAGTQIGELEVRP